LVLSAEAGSLWPGHQFEQTGEVAVEFGFADGGHALGALDLGVNETGGAQDFKMVGPGGFRKFQLYFVAGQWPSAGRQQLPDDGEAAGVGESLHHQGQGDVPQVRMHVGLHGLNLARKPGGNNREKYFLPRPGSWIKFDLCRTMPI